MKLKATILVALTITAAVIAQTTQPVPTGASELEIRAVQTFNKGEYAAAIPLLEKVAVQLKDSPSRVGPILEMIRVAQKNVEAAGGAPAEPPMGAAERKPHAPPEAGQVRELAIKELGNFEYDADKGGNIPEDVKKLSGSTVRVSGYMIPLDQAERITRFTLVPSLFACCFGAPPSLQHTIVVDCPPGKAVNYFPDEIVVEGVLKVGEKKEDDIILSIFELKTTSVKPAVK